jgi:hypothetical protein
MGVHTNGQSLLGAEGFGCTSRGFTLFVAAPYVIACAKNERDQ